MSRTQLSWPKRLTADTALVTVYWTTKSLGAYTSRLPSFRSWMLDTLILPNTPFVIYLNLRYRACVGFGIINHKLV
ncbi:hypothetical protein BDV26DRAFT_149187 [Aspergillus bertholletiae]|uniref:Uncharacterized protein n=1 Tax=Aspergillus bertholletiae TaxID=1226010 RepID=A0A5N7AMM7_9EURO|nr:hypothetical protein BDV26DRAFT_149187 [Aspergillus bertholletiae]